MNISSRLHPLTGNHKELPYHISGERQQKQPEGNLILKASYKGSPN
jgi:hypothetical protein